MSLRRIVWPLGFGLLLPGATRAGSLLHVADSICAHACSVSTPAVAEVWARAVRGIRDGDGPAALAVLDSLRTSGAELPESFDLDFAALSAYCLLPGLAQGAPARGRAGRTAAAPDLRLMDAAGRLAPPRSTEWRVLSAESASPAFFFVGRYEVRAPYRLTLRLAGDPAPLRLRTGISDSLRQLLDTRLVHDPARPPVAVEIGVAIDRSQSARLPRDEYLQRMIAGQYDGVSLADDLPGRPAVSVRCVRTYPGMPDDYRAFVVLDIPRRRPRSDRAPAGPHSGPPATRYVIVMRGRGDVKQEAEDLLAYVIARFAAML